MTGRLWIEAGTGYGAYFQGFIANGVEPVIWQAPMLLATAVVVAGGVRAGIERINRWLMPVLALIILSLAVFALTLPGCGRGVSFFLAPDWSAFGRPILYLNALGQAFFSIGVGMAVFVTYGSYLPRETRIPGSAAAIVAGDTLFALVAGLAIFPAVFAFGGDPAAGPRLAFIAFPQILLEMPAGRFIGIVFFFLLSAAALTSMISLLEVAAAYSVHRHGVARGRAAALIGATVLLIGVPSALSYGTLSGLEPGGRPLLDAIDHSVSNFVLPIGGLLIALMVGWRLDLKSAPAGADLSGWLGTVWVWLLRFLVPATVAVILLRSAAVL